MHGCYLDNSNPDTSYADGATLKVQEVMGGLMVSLLQFPIKLPRGVVVTGGKIQIYPSANSDNVTLKIARMIQAWEYDDATWNEWDNSENEAWDTAGASGADKDYSSTNQTSIAVPTGDSAYKDIDLDSDLIAQIIDAATSRDQNWKCRLAIDGAGLGAWALQFNGLTGTYPPILTIEYTESGSMLAMGGI